MGRERKTERRPLNMANKQRPTVKFSMKRVYIYFECGLGLVGVLIHQTQTRHWKPHAYQHTYVLVFVHLCACTYTWPYPHGHTYISTDKLKYADTYAHQLMSSHDDDDIFFCECSRVHAHGCPVCHGEVREKLIHCILC